MSDQSDDRTDGAPSIGDQNVERLLSTAYQPETLDPAFVQRVQQRAQEQSQRRVATTQQEEGTSRFPPNPTWPLLAVVATVLMLVSATLAVWVWSANTKRAFHDGQYVWIDGKAYVLAEQQMGAKSKEVLVPVDDPPRTLRDVAVVGQERLVPRTRPRAKDIERAAIGARVVTEPGARRHLVLPDGSELFVDESSSLTVEGDRRIHVSSGQVFVSVIQATDKGDVFMVETPQREVTALGTKFAVGVSDLGTAVAVTQGKVKVSGVDSLLEAGQQLHPEGKGDSPRISPMPRASHVLHWTRDLVAAAESPLVPSSEHDGGSLIAVDPNGQQMHLSLRKYHVDVHIEDGFARTTIDQTYFNHAVERLEGTFYFPLPADASISRLAMYVNGKLMEGGMAEREHARNVFETIKYRSLDPALLEWVDGSTFKMRVFPLEGRQEKRIVLSYTQKLETNYGRTEYRFPAGHNMDVVRDWSVKVHVRDGEELQWKCPSHKLSAVEGDRGLTLTAEGRNVQPNRDIVVELKESEEDVEASQETIRFSTVLHEDAKYLMLRFRPELKTQVQQQRRDWVFLVDADGSRNPLLARVQADIVRTILENASHEDTFSIITAGTRHHAFATEQKPVSPDNLDLATKFLDSTHLVGALDLERALTAADSYIKAAADPMVVHVGSAIPILGQRDTAKLLEKLSPDVPYVGVGVGKRWNRHWMRAAASKTGGFFTQINPDEPVQWRALELFSTLNAPRLLDIRVTGNDQQQSAFLLVKDWAAHGEEICAIIRSGPGVPSVDALTVKGNVDGDTFERVIAVKDVKDGAAYLPRIWAKLAIDEMVATDAQQNKATIIDLSKSMYVMSPFTSLLVLENDAMYEQYNVDRGRKDHWALYPCPEQIEVVHEPIGEGPLTQSNEEGEPEEKPTMSQVMETLLVRSGSGYSTLADKRRVRVARSVNGRDYLLTDLSRQPEALGEVRFDISVARLQPTQVAFDFDGDVDLNGNADFDMLIDTITVDSWEDVGGPGAIQGFPTNLSLVVSQTQEVHEAVVDPLSLPFVTSATPAFPPLVEMSGTSFSDGYDVPLPDEPPLVYPDVNVWQDLTNRRQKYAVIDFAGSISISEQQILEQLRQSADFNYRNQSLNDIVDDLADRFDIQIELDVRAFEEIGFDRHHPSISLVARDIRLKSALHLMLQRYDLAHVVMDEVLQITSIDEVEQRSGSRSFWFDEMFFVIKRKSSASVDAELDGVADELPDLTDDRYFEYLSGMLKRRLDSTERPQLLYPKFSSYRTQTSFRRLVNFAPAMNTTMADARAVLDAEAHRENPLRVGKVDPRAKELIDAARERGWQRLTLQDRKGRPALKLVVDGQGRYRYEHKTQHGLREVVVCDGVLLRHLYPELGLGTKRVVSRFHRNRLTKLVPWFLPPVEDLMRGFDLRMVGPRTIAIVPHGQEDDELREHQRVHLIFDTNNRLVERRAIEMPSAKTLSRIVFDADGKVRWFDGAERQLDERSIAVEDSGEPDLDPEVGDLVILPMPIREHEHVYQTVRQSASNEEGSDDALRAIAEDEEQTRLNDPAHWSEDDALKLVATYHWTSSNEMQDVIGRRFFARGDRRLGFYTLLLSSGARWDVEQPVALDDGTTTQMDPLADHPDSLLAGYIAKLLARRSDKQGQRQETEGADDNRFIQQLSEHRRLSKLWTSNEKLPADAEARRRQIDRVFDFIAQCDSPRFSYILLRQIQRRMESSQPHGRIAEALIELEKQGTFSYVVKYELARSLAEVGQTDQARQLFQQLYRETLKEGILPPIDQAFRNVIGSDDEDPFAFDDDPFDFDDDEARIDDLMRGAATYLIQRRQRPKAIALAWQCRQLGDVQLGDDIFDQVLTGVPHNQRLSTTLAALDYLLMSDDHDRAGTLLESLLQDDPYSQSPALWRLAAEIAEHNGHHAKTVSHLETALDLEYRDLPEAYNVEAVRDRYAELFAKYRKLARTVVSPRTDIPLGLASRAVRSADRWRSLDTDVTGACTQAARLLDLLGNQQLAWDYLTTPLAMNPNEAAAWLDLAESLSSDGELHLADRAYASAFDAEPTNAEILWSRAQLLERAGEGEEALKLYSQIAKGTWQPRFDWVKQRAERVVAGHE